MYINKLAALLQREGALVVSSLIATQAMAAPPIVHDAEYYVLAQQNCAKPQ